MPRNTLPAPPRVCSNCDGPVSAAGRKSETGLYFCGKDECRAAKQRDYYARIAQTSDRPDAPNHCAHCGDDLTPRKMRHGDHPERRWCKRIKCQRNRHSFLAAERSPQSSADAIEFLTKVVMEDFVPCPACGEERAVDGFPHIDEYNGPCTALLAESSPGQPKLPPKNRALWKKIWGDRVQ